jgi:hypothetical protein
MNFTDEKYFRHSIPLTSTDMSASITSQAISVLKHPHAAIQAVCTGSPVGTFTLEASVDGTNFATITNSSQAVSGADSVLWNLAGKGFAWVRVVYTRTSGTGTLAVHTSGKGT